MKAKTNKLEHYAELTKALKQRVLDYDKKVESTPYAVDESTIQFALTSTPNRVSRATYERVRTVLNMNTVKSRLVIRAHRIQQADKTTKDVRVTTDIKAKKSKLTKEINDILHKDITQSETLERQLYFILNKMGIDPTNLQAGTEYKGIKVDEKYKTGDDIAKHITFKEVSPEIASMIAEVPGTNPNTTGMASAYGNMNLQTWKDADAIEDTKEREAKQKKVKAMIDANPDLYNDFANLTEQEIEDLQTYMSKSQAWKIAKKGTQDSDQVKENWTKLYVKGKEARHIAIATGNFKPFDEFRRLLKKGEDDADKVLSAIDDRIKEVLKK